eukprot:gene8356-9040_t
MWTERVDKKYKPLVDALVNNCDWSWTSTAMLINGQPLTASHIADYQVFILCKLITGDLKVDSETKRLRLSPTEQIDEVWHQHLLRPVSYYEMCRKVYEAKQKLSLDVEEGKGSLLGDKVVDGSDYIIDHTPESSNDSEEMKYERYKVTKSYLLKVCPGYIFTNPPLNPSEKTTKLAVNVAQYPKEWESRSTPDSGVMGLFDGSYDTDNDNGGMVDLFGEESFHFEEVTPEEAHGPLFTVRLKKLTGAISEVPNVHANMKVIDLMRIYEGLEGVPVDQQRYIFNGRQMNEEDRLTIHNIEYNSLITVVLKLRGC